MAQEDLELLFKTKEKYRKPKEKLNEVIKILSEDDVKDYKLFSLESDIKKIIIDMDKEISTLERYSLCPHNNIARNVYDSHDSHKDYYKDYCKDCGKIINEYSV